MNLSLWGKNGITRIYVNNVTAIEKSRLASLPFVTLKGATVSIPPVPWLVRQIVDTYKAQYTSTIIDEMLQQKPQNSTIHNVPWVDILQPYQLDTVAFGRSRKRFICADDRGLGKTLEALTLCCAEGLENVLIVTPNYLKYTWEREIKHWQAPYIVTLASGTRTTRETALNTHANSTSPKALVVNYEMLRKSESTGGYIEQLTRDKFDAVIFDEAHRLKGRKSKWSEGALAFQSVPYMVMLTGNPIDKNPDDLWSLLHILYPKHFTSYWAFVNYFCNINETLFGREILGVNKEHEGMLADLLKEYIIQHTKSAVAEFLPEKHHRTIYVSLEPKQRKFYNTIEKEMVLEYQDGAKDDIQTFATKHLRLCQAAVCPKSISGPDVSAVDDAVIGLCEDLRGETQKIIVAAYFVAHADALEQKLTALQNTRVFRITAKLKPEQRDTVIQAFKAHDGPETAVLVGTIKTMSEGLNIDECNCMIFADKAFTPMPNEQMEDRIHRLTSTQTKTYYTVLACDTVQEDKESVLMRRAVDRDELWARMETLKKAAKRHHEV